MSGSAQRSPKPKDGPPHGASPEWFRHKGLEVAVHRAGDHGPGVVLLHNGGTSHSIWRHQIADLATDHRVVAVDRPALVGDRASPAALDLLNAAVLVRLTPRASVSPAGRGNLTRMGVATPDRRQDHRPAGDFHRPVT